MVDTFGARGEIKRDQLGVGQVVIPDDVDRDEHIARCCREGWTYLYVYELGVIKALVGKSIKNYIEYPVSGERYGSSVMFVRKPSEDSYFAFEVFDTNNDIVQHKEADFILSRTLGGKTVSVTGDASTGSISILVSDRGTASVINIEEGAVSVESGDVKASATSVGVLALDSVSFSLPEVSGGDGTSISYKRGVGLSYVDEFGNEVSATKDAVTIKGERINLGQGGEPILLGDKTVSLLKDFISAVSNITVATSLGTQPILNKVDVEKLKVDIDKLKSELSFTD